MNFSVESHESEPALLQVVAPNEAIVVIATEVQLGETSGMMNIGIPASVVKLLRQKFDQQWTARKSAMTDESERILSLVHPSQLAMEARVEGSTVYFDDLLALQEGDVLQFDATLEQPVFCESMVSQNTPGMSWSPTDDARFAVPARTEMASAKAVILIIRSRPQIACAIAAKRQNLLHGARPDRLFGHSIHDTRILVLADRSRPCFFHSQ